MGTKAICIMRVNLGKKDYADFIRVIKILYSNQKC